MANPRQEDKSTQRMEDAARHSGEKAAEQTNRKEQAAADQSARVGQSAAQAGEEIARSTANIAEQNFETVQRAWRAGLQATTSAIGRYTEQFGHMFGVSGERLQHATEATEGWAREGRTILFASTAAAKLGSEIAQEYCQMVRKEVETHMDYSRKLWLCRTPQDFVAVQSQVLRQTLEAALDISRRIADLSIKMTDETGKQIKQSI
ncbi:phasin family protein [Bradyrhizobium barranii]|uniref:phasin family protein n=1 Tax=Bradyrhizobium TaxID=374 RepID=UPI003F22B556